MLTAQLDAVTAVRAAAPQIAEAADLVAGRIAAGGRWLFVATDAVAERLVALATGGLVVEFGLADGAVQATTSVTALRPTARDAVVVVATTGATTNAAAELAAATRARAGLVLVTTAAEAAATATTAAGPAAEVLIAPTVGREPVHGDAGLGAATALKAVLDAMTTAVVARHGRVHGDLPVDLVADDDTKRERVVAMVVAIAGVDDDTARLAATAAGHDVRVAVLALIGGLTVSEAVTLAANHRTLRDALANLPSRPPEIPTGGGLSA